MQTTANSVTLADDVIGALLARRTPEVRVLAHALRNLVRAAVPNVVEVIYHGALCYGTSTRRSTLKVYLSFHTSHVNLGFYYGANLPDKDGLLEGEGKRMRHIKVGSLQDVRKRSFQRLVREALRES